MDIPTHRIHSDNEPLPASGTGEGTVDYSADNINRIAAQDTEAHRNTTTTTHHNSHSPSHIPGPASLGADDANRLPPGAGCFPETHCEETRFDERPGLSSDDSSAVPHVKPGIGDKIIGKSEKVKYFHVFSFILLLLRLLLACGEDNA